MSTPTPPCKDFSARLRRILPPWLRTAPWWSISMLLHALLLLALTLVAVLGPQRIFDWGDGEAVTMRTSSANPVSPYQNVRDVFKNPVPVDSVSLPSDTPIVMHEEATQTADVSDYLETASGDSIVALGGGPQPPLGIGGGGVGAFGYRSGGGQRRMTMRSGGVRAVEEMPKRYGGQPYRYLPFYWKNGSAVGALGEGTSQETDATKPPHEEAEAVIAAEEYGKYQEQAFKRTSDLETLSTFAVDVDTASYSNARRMLNEGHLPPADAVRIEEFVNYFGYNYAQPKGERPFAVHAEVADCPWNAKHRLALIGLKGKELEWEKRPAANLVFLVDVSGSMSCENRLPLVKKALRMLVDKLDGRDRIAIAVYAGASGLALESTPVSDKEKIVRAIENMQAGGGTNGAAGIQLAYRTAHANLLSDGLNRVILCTDGDFNVGVSDNDALVELVRQEAKQNVFLTVLGFGMGNYKDGRLEALADKGNGNYAYIDHEREARKVLVNQVCGTLVTIAKDVKIQVEFNPATVAEYRLIGYENRLLKTEEFRDDKKDAGEIGAGHCVTALYEIVPAESDTPSPEGAAAMADELFTVYLRWKQPKADWASEFNVPVRDARARDWRAASENFRWAAAVTMFGLELRASQYKGATDWALIKEVAATAASDDGLGYRREFLNLVQIAQKAATR